MPSRVPVLVVALTVVTGIAACHSVVGSTTETLEIGVCAPAGWTAPGGMVLAGEELLDQMAAQSVVLLGEQHDQAAHHRWQLDTLRELHQRRPQMIIGLEMFPRRVQAALDAWVRGELSEDEFLQQSDWKTVWGFDPALYMDIFRFARDSRVKLRALNVEAALTRKVGRNGFAAIPSGEREGISTPATPDPAYVSSLEHVFSLHAAPHMKGSDAEKSARLRGFIDAQLVWDRAMAQGIYAALNEHPEALLVGLMGSGHLRHGHGVPHQLRDLGVSAQSTLLPWDNGHDCAALVAGVADAVYLLDPGRRPTRSAPL